MKQVEMNQEKMKQEETKTGRKAGTGPVTGRRRCSTSEPPQESFVLRLDEGKLVSARTPLEEETPDWDLHL